MNIKRDWPLILPMASTLASVVNLNSTLSDYVVKLSKQYAWNSPLWLSIYASILAAGLIGSLFVSFRRNDYRNYFIAMLCSFAAFILTILEQGLGQIWWNLLTSLPLGTGYVVVFAFAAGMMGGFCYLHYSVIVLPNRIQNLAKTTPVRLSVYI